MNVTATGVDGSLSTAMNLVGNNTVRDALQHLMPREFNVRISGDFTTGSDYSIEEINTFPDSGGVDTNNGVGINVPANGVYSANVNVNLGSSSSETIVTLETGQFLEMTDPAGFQTSGSFTVDFEWKGTSFETSISSDGMSDTGIPLISTGDEGNFFRLIASKMDASSYRLRLECSDGGTTISMEEIYVLKDEWYKFTISWASLQNTLSLQVNDMERYQLTAPSSFGNNSSRPFVFGVGSGITGGGFQYKYIRFHQGVLNASEISALQPVTSSDIDGFRCAILYSGVSTEIVPSIMKNGAVVSSIPSTTTPAILQLTLNNEVIKEISFVAGAVGGHKNISHTFLAATDECLRFTVLNASQVNVSGVDFSVTGLKFDAIKICRITLEEPEKVFDRLSVYTDPGFSAVEVDNNGIHVDCTSAVTKTADPVLVSAGDFYVTYSLTSPDYTVSKIRKVTVIDTAIPVISLIGAATITHERATAYIDLGATASDGDSNLTSVMSVLNAVLEDTIGTYEVTYDVIDQRGNRAQQVKRTVNVVDSIPPIITVTPGANNQIGQSVERLSSYSDPGATAIDQNGNEDLTNRIISYGSVDTSTVGNYTIIYQCDDISGNFAAQKQRTVAVVSTTKPQIFLNGPGNLTIERLSGYVDQGAIAFAYSQAGVRDNENDYTASIIVTNPVDHTRTGTFIVRYNVQDVHGIAADEVIRTVTVQDTAPPAITIVGANPFTLERLDNFVDPGATALDGDIDYTSSIVATNLVDNAVANEYYVHYDVQDVSGNTAVRKTRKVIVVDTIKPHLFLNGPYIVTVERLDTYDDQGATALDYSAAGVEDVDLTSQIEVANLVNMSVVGDYTIRYNVSDASGNSADEITRLVQVRDTTPPVITILGNVTHTHERLSTYIDASATAVDGNGGEDLTSRIQVSSQLDTSVTGDYTIIYSCTDDHGNASQVTRMVYVRDSTKPIITLTGPTTLIHERLASYIDQGAVAFDVTEGGEQAENLTNLLSVDMGGFDGAVNGTYTFTYTVSDAAGNAADAKTRTVTVNDTVTPAITILGSNPVTVERLDSYVDAGAIAVDGDTTLTSDIITTSTSLDTSAVGTYTVSYNVADASGNSAQASRTVNVVDTTPPQILVLGGDINVARESTYVDGGAVAYDYKSDGSQDLASDLTSAIVTTVQAKSYDGTNTWYVKVVNSSGSKFAMLTTTAFLLYPEITLTAGESYTFDQSDSSNYGHPLRFFNSDGEEYSTSTSGTPGQAGATVILTVPLHGYTDMRYVCQHHGQGMGNVIHLNANSNAVNTFTCQKYKICYDVNDPHGNAATQVYRMVTVTDNLSPNISLVGGTVTLERAIDSYSEPGYTASDGTVDLTERVVVTNNVNTLLSGEYHYHYDLTDASGNAASRASRLVRVLDTRAPTILLNNGLNGQVTQYVERYSIYNDPGGSAMDDGDISVPVSVVNLVDKDTPGQYTVTYTATDVAGNAQTATRTVHVTDNTNPVITLHRNDLNPYYIEVGTDSYTEHGAVAVDGNGGPSLSVSTLGSVNSNQVGNYTITYTATDSTGQSVQRTREVIVRDTVKPVISLIGSNPVELAAGSIGFYSDAGATVSDASATATMSTSNNVDVNVSGTYQFTYNAIDGSGNAADPVIRTVVVFDNGPTVVLDGDTSIVVEAGSILWSDPGATYTSSVSDGDASDNVPLNVDNFTLSGNGGEFNQILLGASNVLKLNVGAFAQYSGSLGGQDRYYEITYTCTLDSKCVFTCGVDPNRTFNIMEDAMNSGGDGGYFLLCRWDGLVNSSFPVTRSDGTTSNHAGSGLMSNTAFKPIPHYDGTDTQRWNTLAIEFTSTQVKGYVNGHLIGTIDDSSSYGYTDAVLTAGSMNGTVSSFYIKNFCTGKGLYPNAIERLVNLNSESEIHTAVTRHENHLHLSTVNTRVYGSPVPFGTSGFITQNAVAGTQTITMYAGDQESYGHFFVGLSLTDSIDVSSWSAKQQGLGGMLSMNGGLYVSTRGVLGAGYAETQVMQSGQAIQSRNGKWYRIVYDTSTSPPRMYFAYKQNSNVSWSPAGQNDWDFVDENGWEVQSSTVTENAYIPLYLYVNVIMRNKMHIYTSWERGFASWNRTFADITIPPQISVASVAIEKHISINISDGDTYSVTSDAGAILAYNWNNVHGGNNSNVQLIDSTGAASGAIMNSTGGRSQAHSMTSIERSDGADGSLFYGYIDNFHDHTLTITNIPIEFQAQGYELRIYHNTDSRGTMGFRVEDGTGLSKTYYSYADVAHDNYPISGTDQYGGRPGYMGSQNTQDNHSTPSNYTYFDGLSGSSLTITGVNGNNLDGRSRPNAFQITTGRGAGAQAATSSQPVNASGQSTTLDSMIATPGIYTITYTGTDNTGLSGTTNRTISVQDTRAPVLSSVSDVTVERGHIYSDQKPSAYDPRDSGNIDLSAHVIQNFNNVNTNIVGDYQVDYEVSDGTNTSTSQRKNVYVRDNVSPTITLTGDGLSSESPMTWTQGDISSWSEPGYSAIDTPGNIDLTEYVTVDASNIDFSAVGDYNVYYNLNHSSYGPSAIQVVRYIRVNELILLDTTPVASGVPGLLAQKYTGNYFDDRTWFSNNPANKLGSESIVTNIENSDNGSSYSWNWTGAFIPHVSGIWNFWTSSSDSSHVWINDLETNTTYHVVDNGGSHGTQQSSGTFNAEAAKVYGIQVTFENVTSAAYMRMDYQPPGQTRINGNLNNALTHYGNVFNTYYEQNSVSIYWWDIFNMAQLNRPFLSIFWQHHAASNGIQYGFWNNEGPFYDEFSSVVGDIGPDALTSTNGYLDIGHNYGDQCIHIDFTAGSVSNIKIRGEYHSTAGRTSYAFWNGSSWSGQIMANNGLSTDRDGIHRYGHNNSHLVWTNSDGTYADLNITPPADAIAMGLLNGDGDAYISVTIT